MERDIPQDQCAKQAERLESLSRRIREAEEVAPPSQPYSNANVRKVENGFILEIGCKTFVAKNWEEASTGLKEYWDDPRAAQKKYSNS